MTALFRPQKAGRQAEESSRQRTALPACGVKREK